MEAVSSAVNLRIMTNKGSRCKKQRTLCYHVHQSWLVTVCKASLPRRLGCSQEVPNMWTEPLLSSVSSNQTKALRELKVPLQQALVDNLAKISDK